ncbi:MAG: Dolichyl-phosphate mannose synthase related protein [Candidatus Beckwithbacteria bacterium GW2011_GWC2_47_9]|uniref:Dolichyl-phosphate mannose synthase related protein n=3 Tax=Candidatus Beckwithiibacteriota TaxID=1752726 RepID=A0A0G1U0V5_9BACT|nr:MAG: Dolichyl-phosphate mannose synthase related protein [Candidatus Beckwithbacteria bacterium GW2011_GWC2_47_9]OGD55609.1 MAG: glycosyl transferase [Candidatus Beckwithbacteria bacterium RIFCSPHIGHO2_12_FULL_47_17]OGD57871.1 MAG: glycosyl transferase [Candidatus Beckwithbacteria bacterium RIFCSPLOWO2_02_FULL_47_23]
MKLSIIIPSFNEAATLAQAIKRVKQVKLSNIIKEIIVVDDGSTDGTRKNLTKITGITKIILPKNQGKGAAIRHGLTKAAGDYVLIQDADLEYDPEDIPALLEPILTGKARVVYGSRFIGPHKNMLFWHMVGNKLLSLVTNFLFNTTISDMEVGYKLIPRKLLKSLKLESDRFGFEPEVTAKILKTGVRIYEVPISYAGREFSEGKKITWKDGLRAFYLLWKYRLV